MFLSFSRSSNFCTGFTLQFNLFSLLWFQAELQYLHHHAGVAASVGLNANPVVNLSGVFGTKTIAVGADASYDTSSGDLTKYNAGLSYTTSDFVASATL